MSEILKEYTETAIALGKYLQTEKGRGVCGNGPTFIISSATDTIHEVMKRAIKINGPCFIAYTINGSLQIMAVKTPVGG